MPMRRGYTLIEVMIVVIVVSIVAAVIVPQMLQAGTLGVQAAARMIISDILYAQNEAVAQQGTRQVVFDVDGNSYRVTDGDGVTLTTPWHGGSGEHRVDLSEDNRFAGVRITAATFGGEPTLAFDDMGGAASGGHVIIEFNDERFRINVAAFTGRVTVEKL
ncbi:MAG: GspH/FimT family protein [Phycisphaeraceae bacterium]